MIKTINLLLFLLFLTGCSSKSPDMIETETKAYKSHQRQYHFDQKLHNHHNDIKGLHKEVNELMDDMDGGNNKNYNNNGCDNLYIKYVKLLNQGTDQRAIYFSRQNFLRCKERQKNSQERW